MPDEIRSNDVAAVNKALDQLMLHFDSATVFVTRQDGSKTVGGAWGRGNWYSRYGIVSEWCENGGGLDTGGEDTDIDQEGGE
jgi:hypothetical protein